MIPPYLAAMGTGNSIPRFLRLGSLLALAAFALHQIRYLLAYGSQSGEQLSHQGHDYLASALPVLAGLALAAVVATLLGARLGTRLTGSPGTARRALVYGAAVFAIYAGQELLEGALSAGHPAGLGALLYAGGWLAAPLALAVGAVTALLARGLESIECVLSRAEPAVRRPRAPARTGSPRPPRRLTALLSPLAFGLARRPPPAAVHAH